jgi:hypothetical protein
MSTGSILSVDATTQCKVCAVVAVSATKAIVVWTRRNGGTDYVFIAELDIAGTTVTITDGPDTVASGASPGPIYTNMSLVKFDASYVIWTYEFENELYARVITISGLSVTSATKLVDNATVDVLSHPDICNDNGLALVDSNTCVAAYNVDDPDTGSGCRVVAFNVSAGAIGAIGTPVELSPAGRWASVDALSTSQIIVGDQDDTEGRIIALATVATTTITAGAAYTLWAGKSEGTVIKAIDSTHALVGYEETRSVVSDSLEMWSITLGTVTDEFKALGMSVSKGAGGKLYVTGWAEGDLLILNVYELPSLNIIGSYSLGTATEAQVDARTWWAHPLALYWDDDEVVIFGRMNDPASLGTVHMLHSDVAGLDVTIMENGMGSNHIGAAAQDIYGNLYAMENISAAAPKLHFAVPPNLLLLLSTATGVTAGVNPKAMSADWQGNVVVGMDTGASVMVIYTPDPFIAWFDITGNHGTANPINALEVL